MSLHTVSTKTLAAAIKAAALALDDTLPATNAIAFRFEGAAVVLTSTDRRVGLEITVPARVDVNPPVAEILVPVTALLGWAKTIKVRDGSETVLGIDPEDGRLVLFAPGTTLTVETVDAAVPPVARLMAQAADVKIPTNAPIAYTVEVLGTPLKAAELMLKARGTILPIIVRAGASSTSAVMVTLGSGSDVMLRAIVMPVRLSV